jgi:uncharacterized membrane protein
MSYRAPEQHVEVGASFIYAFAGLSVVVFLYAFHKAQP